MRPCEWQGQFCHSLGLSLGWLTPLVEDQTIGVDDRPTPNPTMLLFRQGKSGKVRLEDGLQRRQGEEAVLRHLGCFCR